MSIGKPALTIVPKSRAKIFRSRTPTFRFMPLTALTALVASFSIAGVPLFNLEPASIEPFLSGMTEAVRELFSNREDRNQAVQYFTEQLKGFSSFDDNLMSDIVKKVLIRLWQDMKREKGR
jgi:hypothetical protein